MNAVVIIKRHDTICNGLPRIDWGQKCLEISFGITFVCITIQES